MGSFTKKRFKTSKEFVKDLKKGDLGLTKKQFSIEETVQTVKLLAGTAVELKEKVDELKEVGRDS